MTGLRRFQSSVRRLPLLPSVRSRSCALPCELRKRAGTDWRRRIRNRAPLPLSSDAVVWANTKLGIYRLLEPTTTATRSMGRSCARRMRRLPATVRWRTNAIHSVIGDRPSVVQRPRGLCRRGYAIRSFGAANAPQTPRGLRRIHPRPKSRSRRECGAQGRRRRQKTEVGIAAAWRRECAEAQPAARSLQQTEAKRATLAWLHG
jgi:hypothetical protein